MAISVTHTFVSPVADDGDPNEVGPNEWNAAHTISGLGTAAEADSTDFATAAQGTLADSALQAADIANMLETSDIGVTVQAHSAVLDATTASFTTAQETKLGHISVTQAVDLDAIETRVNALDAAVVLKGSWDASAGTFPGGGTAQAGDSYIVSVAGTVNSVAFALNDRIIAITDNASTTTFAANWFKADYTDQVLSVAGRTGTVTLGAADITDLGSGVGAFLVTPSSANLRAALTDETGTGGAVFADSPSLTGAPTAPTAAVDTNTTQLATTAMVLGQAAAATPLGDMATAAVGTSTRYARADHVHPGREVLTAARTYYVRTDGSNSNTGLVDSSGGAFLTIQKAIDVVAALDISTQNVTIQVRDGTYSANIRVTSAWLGSGTVTLQGNTSTPANCVITSSVTVQVSNGGRLTINGFEVQASSIGISATRNGVITLGANMRFGACTSYHWEATFNGIVVGASYAIVGAAGIHMRLDSGGVGQFAAMAVTLTGTLAFSPFVEVTGGAILSHFSTTWTGGTITGSRYSANLNGVINTFGGGANVFPGNAVGTTATGGQYA
jgi:hypothetical protein